LYQLIDYSLAAMALLMMRDLTGEFARLVVDALRAICIAYQILYDLKPDNFLENSRQTKTPAVLTEGKFS
jgi:hypothetical protein